VVTCDCAPSTALPSRTERRRRRHPRRRRAHAIGFRQASPRLRDATTWASRAQGLDHEVAERTHLRGEGDARACGARGRATPSADRGWRGRARGSRARGRAPRTRSAARRSHPPLGQAKARDSSGTTGGGRGAHDASNLESRGVVKRGGAGGRVTQPDRREIVRGSPASIKPGAWGEEESLPAGPNATRPRTKCKRAASA
jgi:hypothetical protein